MAKTPIIFLKKEWGKLGPCYNVVAFSKKGFANEIIDLLKKEEECWICIQIKQTGEVRCKKLKGHFVQLIKFEPADEPMQTVDHIIKKAVEAAHRVDENGDLMWPYCFKIKEICNAKHSKHATKIMDMRKYNNGGSKTISGFTRLDAHDTGLLLDYFFNQRKSKWKSAKKKFYTDFVSWIYYTFFYKHWSNQ